MHTGMHWHLHNNVEYLAVRLAEVSRNFRVCRVCAKESKESCEAAMYAQAQPQHMTIHVEEAMHVQIHISLASYRIARHIL
jgi:recombinational DNA repair protein RecR